MTLEFGSLTATPRSALHASGMPWEAVALRAHQACPSPRDRPKLPQTDPFKRHNGTHPAAPRARTDGRRARQRSNPHLKIP